MAFERLKLGMPVSMGIILVLAIFTGMAAYWLIKTGKQEDERESAAYCKVKDPKPTADSR